MKKCVSDFFGLIKKRTHYRYDIKYNSAFTIVELIIVVTIIGILSIIVLVSYVGVAEKANIASLSSDLNNASKQLEMFLVENNNYPITINCNQPDSLSNRCVKSSSGLIYQYSSINNSKTYCISASINELNYRIKNNSTISEGNCLDYGLVMHLDAGNYESYSGSGTIWSDLSGNNLEATLFNGVTYTTDAGGAMSFDGANDYVNIPYANQFNIKYAISLSIWIKRTSGFNQLQDTMILGRPPAWYFYDSYNSGNIHSDVFIDGTRRAARTVAVPFDGNWYQVTYTYDSNNQTSKIYRNGILSSSITITGLTNYLIDSSTANFSRMGQNTVGRTMIINDAYVYSRALLTEEITQHYNLHKSRYGL